MFREVEIKTISILKRLPLIGVHDRISLTLGEIYLASYVLQNIVSNHQPILVLHL